MKEVVLGAECSFMRFPVEIEIERHSYYLIKTEGGGYGLLSRVCPHAGYMVEAEGAQFFCDAHGWSFDGRTGKCLNSWGKLDSCEVFIRDGDLITRLP